MAPQSNSNHTNTTSINITKPKVINTGSYRNNADNTATSDGGRSRNNSKSRQSSSRSSSSDNSGSSSSDEELSESITRLGAERLHPTQHSGLPRVKLRVSRPPGQSQAIGSSQADGAPSGDEDWWEAERIIDERRNKYLVEWAGADENGQPYKPTWEFKSNVTKELEDEWKKGPQAEKKQSRRKRKRANSELINARSAEEGQSGAANQGSRRPTKVARPVKVSKEDRLRARRKSTHTSERESSSSEEESEYSPSQPLSQPQQIRRIIFTTPKPSSPAAAPSIDFSSVKRIKIKFKGQATQTQEIEDSFELPSSSHPLSSRRSQVGEESCIVQVPSSSDDSDDRRVLQTSDIDRGYTDWDAQSEPGSSQLQATPFQRTAPYLPRNTTVIPDSQGTFVASGDLSASTIEQSPLNYKHVPAGHPIKKCSIAIEGTNIIRRRSEPYQEEQDITLPDQDQEARQTLNIISSAEVPPSSLEDQETEDFDVQHPRVGLSGDPISSATAPPGQSQNALDIFDPIETQSSRNIVDKPTVTSLHTLAEAAAAHNTQILEDVEQEEFLNNFNNINNNNSPEGSQLHKPLESQHTVQSSGQNRSHSAPENRSLQDAQIIPIPPIIDTQSTDSKSPSRGRETFQSIASIEEDASETVEDITKVPSNYRLPSQNLEESILNKGDLPRHPQDEREQQHLSSPQPSLNHRDYTHNSVESVARPEELSAGFIDQVKIITDSRLPLSTSPNNNYNDGNNSNKNNISNSPRHQRVKGNSSRSSSSGSSTKSNSQAPDPSLQNHLVEPLINPPYIPADLNNSSVKHKFDNQLHLFHQKSPSSVSKVKEWFKAPGPPEDSPIPGNSSSMQPHPPEPDNNFLSGSEDNQDINMSDAVPNASTEALASHSPASKLSSKELFEEIYQKKRAMREASEASPRAPETSPKAAAVSPKALQASPRAQSEAGTVLSLLDRAQAAETTEEALKQLPPVENLSATTTSDFDDALLAGSQALQGIKDPQKKLAAHEYCVPLSLTEVQSNLYKQVLANNYRTIEAFFGAVSSQLSSTQPQPSIEDMRKCATQLEDTAVHVELARGQKHQHYENGNVNLGRWLVQGSTKFSVLHTILQKWKDEEKHVVVVAKEGSLMDLLEVFMHCWKFSFLRIGPSTGSESLNQYDGKLKVSIVPSGKIDSAIPVGHADLVVALDSTFDPSASHIALARGSENSAPVVWLIVVYSSEHINFFTQSSWDEPFHLNAVLFAALLLRDKVGQLSAEAASSNERLKDMEIVDWLETCASKQIPPLLLTEDDEDSPNLHSNDEIGAAAFQKSTEESAALNSRKRQLERTNSFEQVQNIVVSPKRPRMDIDGEDGDDETPMPKESEIEPAASASPEVPEDVNTGEAMDIGNDDSLVDGDNAYSVDADVDVDGSRVEDVESDKEMDEVDDLNRLSYHELLQLYQREQQESKQFVADAARLQTRFEEREEQNRGLRKQLLVANKKITELDTVRLRQSDKITNLQSEIRVLKDERDSKERLLRNESKEIQRLSKLEPELRNAQAQIDLLKNKVEHHKADYEYIRGEYQKASSTAAENGRENTQLREQLKDIERKADDVKTKLLEMSYTNELAQKNTEIAYLKAVIVEREDHIRRIDIENKRVEKSRPLMTRASSVPRQRASPTPSASRASSPAPHSGTMPLPFNLNPNSGRETSHPLQQVRSSGI